jgi:heterodisulfide reductase subunit A-like polyferredoxin
MIGSASAVGAGEYRSEVLQMAVRTGTCVALSFGIGLLLAGCASGPADIADAFASMTVNETSAVKTEEERAALVSDLEQAGDRQASEGRAAASGLPSAVALSIIRQQQVEEARALLEESGSFEAAEPCDPAVTPACPAPTP